MLSRTEYERLLGEKDETIKDMREALKAVMDEPDSEKAAVIVLKALSRAGKEQGK